MGKFPVRDYTRHYWDVTENFPFYKDTPKSVNCIILFIAEKQQMIELTGSDKSDI